MARQYVEYSHELALSICELVADGTPLTHIEKMDGMPSRKSIYRWLSQYPKFYDAYQRAFEVSAQSMEERANLIAMNLEAANDYTGVKVSALNYAMQQYRWSASRRDKNRYGQQQVGVTAVPIQINTTLNLGQEGFGAAQDIAKSIYTVEAVVTPRLPDPETADTGDDTPMIAYSPDEAVEVDTEMIDTSPDDFVPEPPPKPEPKPRQPRRKPGHKSPGATARTASTYAKKNKTE